MITWVEYKKFKAIAEACIKNDAAFSDDVQIEVLKFKLERQKKEETLEKIINHLSGGQHFKDNKFYVKLNGK